MPNLPSQLEVEAEPPSNELYQVGDYVVSPRDRTVVLNGQEVTIEPKVFEVLVYFCQNRDRYILTQELHDNVWQGRMVSDAAVRRAVSKLRVILGDDSKDPTFIKSGSKKGYKFTCPNSEGDDEQVKKTGISASPNIELHKQKESRLNLRISIRLIVVITIVASSLLVIGRFILPYKNDLSVAPTLLFEYPGEKRFIASTKTGEKVAFSARLPGFTGFQMFIKRQETKDIEQVTNASHNVFRFDFSVDEKSLYFIDLKAGASTLNKVDIEGQRQPAAALVGGFYLLSDLAVSMDGKGVYFNGLKTLTDPSQLYYYDFTLGQYTEVTHKLNDEFHDNKVAVSADGNLLAYVTMMGETREQRVSIKDLNSQRIVNRFYHDKAIYDIEWLDDVSLLVLDRTGVHKINSSTQAKTHLFKDGSLNIKSVNVYSDTEMILLDDRPPEIYFTEIGLPKFNTDEKHIVSVQDNIQQILYAGDTETKLIVKAEGNTTVVSTLKNDRERIHLKTSASMDVYQVALSGRLILTKLDHMLALLDTETNDISYITGGKEFLAEDAVFSKDFRKVLYGDKTLDGWVIVEYDIESKQHKTIIQGFKSIRPLDSGEGYVLANKMDEVFLYNNINKEPVPLEIEISLDLNTRWFVRGENIYWTDFDTRDTTFNVYNFQTKRSHTYPLNNLRADPKFDIDLNGENMIMKSRQLTSTEILKVNL